MIRGDTVTSHHFCLWLSQRPDFDETSALDARERSGLFGGTLTGKMNIMASRGVLSCPTWTWRLGPVYLYRHRVGSFRRLQGTFLLHHARDLHIFFTILGPEKSIIYFCVQDIDTQIRLADSIRAVMSIRDLIISVRLRRWPRNLRVLARERMMSIVLCNYSRSRANPVRNPGSPDTCFGYISDRGYERGGEEGINTQKRGTK